MMTFAITCIGAVLLNVAFLYKVPVAALAAGILYSIALML